MRQNIKDFASIISTTLPVVEPIFEFGSFQVPDQAAFADLRSLFGGKRYVGCDMRQGPGVDMVLNLHAIDLPSESVGLALCFDTLEHVEHPRQALKELHRVLMPDGIVVISSVMNFPIHDYPNDYWRFTPEAFKSILKPFSNVFVGYQGYAKFPHTVIGVGMKGAVPPMDDFENQYERWRNNSRRSIRQLAIDATPPILLPWLSRLFKSKTRDMA